MKTVRIFISSPGDVAAERERAKQVVEVLQRRYAGRLRLKAILWEDLPLGAHSSFQEGIDGTIQSDASFKKGVELLTKTENGIDIAIFILWSRLGSPLGANILKPDGSTYRSGTEREFDLLLQAHEQSEDGRPQILFYRREDEVSFEAQLRGVTTSEKKALIEQKEEAEKFIAEEFHDTETGTNIRAYHTFHEPSGFSKRLRVHLQEQLDSLTGDDFGETVWDTREKGSPFRGIEPFEYEHAPLFFGREDEQLEVRRALREQADSGCAFVIIWGASGSGKSSLARAGVLPEVIQHEVDETIGEWRRTAFTPAELGRDPFLGFLNFLTEQNAFPEAKTLSDPASREALARLLREHPSDVCQSTLFPMIREYGNSGKTRLIILIDQMEEFFTSTDTPEEVREPFFRMLEIFARSGLVWILCTMRSDFYSQGQTSPALRDMRGRKGNIDLTAPGPEAIRRMVEEPVRLSDLNWEQLGGRPLSVKILEDIHGNGEFLPLLEYLLEALYNQKDSDGHLCYHVYEKLGGVRGALNDRAEEIFSAMSLEAKESFAQVVQRIATADSEDGQGFVRRWANYDELCESSGSREFVKTFLQKGNRLFVTKNSEHDGSTTVVSVAHEALLSAWSRLAEWLKEHRNMLKARTAVSEDARRWNELGQNSDYLYRAGAQLDEAIHIMSQGVLEKSEREFVRRSAAAASQEALLGALSDGQNLEEISGSIEKEYSEVWSDTIRHCLSEGTEAQRRNAAAVLVHSKPTTLNDEILAGLNSESNHSIRYELARTLVRRNDKEAFEALAQMNRSEDKDVRSNSRESLGTLLASASMESERPEFVNWLSTLPAEERKGLGINCFFVRLRRSLPVFVFVLIPTMIFAVAGAALVKWLPSIFNYSCVQSTAGFAIGLFHSAPAGMVVGGGVVAGLTFYRMVIGREYTPLGYLRPYGAILTGIISGIIAGFTCVFLILGVYDPMTLSGLGWIPETTTKPAFPELIKEVFWKNLAGYVFPLTSIGTGIGLAIMTNRLRNAQVWHDFLGKQQAIRSLDQLASTIGGLYKVTWRYAWTVPFFVGLFAIIGFAIVTSGSHMVELENRSVQTILLGGIDEGIPEGLSEEDEKAAQEATMQKRMNWKKSPEGTALGIFGDSLAKIVGSYFSIIGMGLGIVIMRNGVYIEPKRA